jgi:hypothetical protein
VSFPDPESPEPTPSLKFMILVKITNVLSNVAAEFLKSCRLNHPLGALRSWTRIQNDKMVFPG